VWSMNVFLTLLEETVEFLWGGVQSHFESNPTTGEVEVVLGCDNNLLYYYYVSIFF